MNAKKYLEQLKNNLKTNGLGESYDLLIDMVSDGTNANTLLNGEEQERQLWQTLLMCHKEININSWAMPAISIATWLNTYNCPD